ncbi:MAG: hypothetical protein ACLP1W_08500 [Rhodomicrobium sp.]
MDLVIHSLPITVLEKLDKRARASGRTVEAVAAAILSDCLDNDRDLEEMDDLQRMVFEMYGGDFPKNEVDRFLADRRLEAAAEAAKLG